MKISAKNYNYYIPLPSYYADVILVFNNLYIAMRSLWFHLYDMQQTPS